MGTVVSVLDSFINLHRDGEAKRTCRGNQCTNADYLTGEYRFQILIFFLLLASRGEIANGEESIFAPSAVVHNSHAQWSLRERRKLSLGKLFESDSRESLAGIRCPHNYDFSELDFQFPHFQNLLLLVFTVTFVNLSHRVLRPISCEPSHVLRGAP